MTIEFQTTYPVAPRVVLGVLTDRRFVTACAVALGALDHRTDVRRGDGRWTVHTHLVVSTGGAPFLLQAVLGERVPIRVVRSWWDRGRGRYDGTWEVAAEARSTALRVAGTAVLDSRGDGADYAADADVDHLSVPGLLQPLAVPGVEHICERALANEAALAVQWLSGRRATSSAHRG